MIPARMAHCATLMMSSAGRPSRFAWRWATQSPTTIEVAMRIPYQRTGNGPNPKIAGIWNAMATPIGLDAATDEVHRMQPNERPLPRLQNDGPRVLRAGPMLRE